MLSTNTLTIIILVIILGLSTAYVWYQTTKCSLCKDAEENTGLSNPSWQALIYVLLMVVLTIIAIVLVQNLRQY